MHTKQYISIINKENYNEALNKEITYILLYNSQFFQIKI